MKHLRSFLAPATLALLALPFVTLPAFSQAAAVAAPAASVDTYRVDATHSEVSFRIRHLVSKTPGRFTRFEGVIQVDNKDMSKSSVTFTIDAASVNTDSKGRDEHLAKADFFDVAKYPTLTFKSVSVKDLGQGRLEVTGDFTLRGVTKRITVQATSLGATVDPWKHTKAGFEATFRINREDFGIVYGKGMLGEEVDITLNIEALKMEPAK